MEQDLQLDESVRLGDLVEQLDLLPEVVRLRETVDTWIEESSPEMRDMFTWQLIGRTKNYRPCTIFSCYTAVYDGPVSDEVMLSAVGLDMYHNISLIIDDILDRSRHRRNKLTLHCRFGNLPALMFAGYLMAECMNRVSDDAFAVEQLAELMKRLGVAECLQWRLRRHPLGVEDWRMIAGEDTGTMFEICARLGTRDNRLKRYGLLLGTLYHGCDDVADVRGSEALGGGGNEDIQDRIVTLPAAIAVRDPYVASLFRSTDDHTEVLQQRFSTALPEAEQVLDKIAAEAIAEALRNAQRPARLIRLVEYTRELSRA
ncbi:MAG: polyprenyl synthetase family protein [Rhodothermales bacterium]